MWVHSSTLLGKGDKVLTVNIPFNKDFDVPYGVVEQIAPGIRRITANNPGPFTFRGTGTYILGEGQVAVIDPGPNLSEHVNAILEGLGNETVSHILITHTHNDHSPAAKALKERTGAPTYGFGPHGSGKAERAITIEAGGDMDFIPDEFTPDGCTIDGDGWRISCVHTPGHTSNHLCFSWDSEKALFPGDQVMGWSTSIVSPPDGDMGDYLRSLDKLLLREDKVFYPTHGPEIREPHTIIKAFQQHRLERERKIIECLDTGFDTIEKMLPVVYADVSQNLHAAAARSLFATIIYLVEEQRIVTLEKLSINSRYRSK